MTTQPLTDDELTELYSDLCDVVERTYHGLPLVDLEDEVVGIRHTSAEARAAANRILDIIDAFIGTDLRGAMARSVEEHLRAHPGLAERLARHTTRGR